METRKRKSNKSEAKDVQSSPETGEIKARSKKSSKATAKAVEASSDSGESPVAPVPLPPGTVVEESKPPIYGPMPTFSKQRLWSRTILILGVLTVIYFNTNTATKESSFATYSEHYPGRAFETKCSPAFEQNIGAFMDCRPRKCGRLITDNVMLPSELLQLTDLARRTLEYDSKIKSLFTVYDLTTGKLSCQDSTVDLVQLNSTTKSQAILKYGDLGQFQLLEAKLKQVIGEHFKLQNYYQTIYLAKPAFFARLTGKGKGSDSYSHVKIDQTNYNSFHYSAIVFLSDYGKDFEGGRFIFPDGDLTNRTVEARKGRVLIYTSGLENKNYIEKVTKGSQIILTIGFTCDLTSSIKRPRLT